MVGQLFRTHVRCSLKERHFAVKGFLKGGIVAGWVLCDGLLSLSVEEDVDGEPMEESLTMAEPPSAPVAFAPSRWETVDPEQVKAQGQSAHLVVSL